MPRPLRFLPQPSLVLVTQRTAQGRMLLRPSPELNDRLLGLLGKAQAEFGMVIHAVAVLSNHFHLLVNPTQAHQLADFMGYFTSRLAQEVGRLYAWEGPVFPQRYRARPVSHEEAAQVEWLQYVLAHGCKEGLVARPEDWPGVHAARALAGGEPLIGHWVDRSGYCRARRSVSRPAGIGEYEHEAQVTLSPLPAWQGLSPERYRGRIQELLDEIATTVAAERTRTGQGVLGVGRILRQDPHQPAPPPERRPMPPILAVASEVREAFVEAYRTFVLSFRLAAQRLRDGCRDADFPPWSFPPAMPRPTG